MIIVYFSSLLGPSWRASIAEYFSPFTTEKVLCIESEKSLNFTGMSAVSYFRFMRTHPFSRHFNEWRGHVSDSFQFLLYIYKESTFCYRASILLQIQPPTQSSKVSCAKAEQKLSIEATFIN